MLTIFHKKNNPRPIYVSPERNRYNVAQKQETLDLVNGVIQQKDVSDIYNVSKSIINIWIGEFKLKTLGVKSIKSYISGKLK